MDDDGYSLCCTITFSFLLLNKLNECIEEGRAVSISAKNSQLRVYWLFLQLSDTTVGGPERNKSASEVVFVVV